MTTAAIPAGPFDGTEPTAGRTQVQVIFSLRGFLTRADEVARLPFPPLRVAKAATVSPPAILTIPEAMDVLELAQRSKA
jgi:hypothetical protein